MAVAPLVLTAATGTVGAGVAGAVIGGGVVTTGVSMGAVGGTVTGGGLVVAGGVGGAGWSAVVAVGGPAAIAGGPPPVGVAVTRRAGCRFRLPVGTTAESVVPEVEVGVTMRSTPTDPRVGTVVAGPWAATIPDPEGRGVGGGLVDGALPCVGRRGLGLFRGTFRCGPCR